MVHDSGRVFDRVREHATPQQLTDATKTVSVSLRQCLSCLPDNQHVEKAINQIRTYRVSRLHLSFACCIFLIRVYLLKFIEEGSMNFSALNEPMMC